MLTTLSKHFSLNSRSLVVLQGRSADVAKRSIPATRKQRILLTFGRSVARKFIPQESAARFTPSLTPSPMPWGPPSRPPANMRPHSPSPKHFGYAPASSVVPAPTAGPHHIPPSDGMQPLFVAPAPVAVTAIPFPAAVPLSNTAPAWMPEAAPPRLPVPGTGVFLPPGSGHQLLPPHQMIHASHAHAEPNSAQGSQAYAHNKATGMEMANGNASPRSSATTKRPDTTEAKAECNGSTNGGCSLVDEKSGARKEQQNGGMKKAGNSMVEPSAAK